MGEIKSTLDLVMERTKNLTMTEDEKKAHRQVKIGKRVAGLIQKIDDQAIKPDEIKNQLQEMIDQFGTDSTNIIVQAILEGVQIDTDNTGRFTILSEYLQIDITPITHIITEFSRNITNTKAHFNKKAKATLAERYHITGSAILPNMDADERWTKEFEYIIDQYQRQLEIETGKLIK